MRFRSVYSSGDGVTATGELEAQDLQALHEQLHRQGCLLLRAEAVADRTERGARLGLPTRRLLAFVQSLQAALDAGVPLLTVLQAMQEQEADARIEAMIGNLAERIGNGESLADALAAWPRAFPVVLRAMVHAGEQSGMLPTVLASVAAFLEWRLSVAATVRQALIYPAVIAVAGYGLLLLLLGFVLPRLTGIISKLGTELPAASRILVDVSTVVAEHMPEVMAVSAAAVAVVVLAVRSDAGRVLLTGLLARLPVAGGIVRTLITAQLCRSLSALLHAGLTMPYALQLAGDAILQRRVRDDVHHARERILGGNKVTESLAEIALLPPVALSMVRVGEDSGRLPETLQHLSSVYDREARDAVKRGLALLEPAITVVLGLTVGGVAVLVITTIYGAMRGLGR